jgi:CDP-glycerol glycerophosphotransferase (TagB/SpsB family)
MLRCWCRKIARKRGGVLKTFLYVLGAPIYLLLKLIPRNDRLYVFGSSHGLHFADNSKYLFLYASRHVDEIKCVFLSRDKDVVRLLSENGYHACCTFSLRGLLTACRAGKCFISNSTHDIHPLFVSGAEIIQLWHGIPLKKICHDVELKRGGIFPLVKYSLREVLFALFPYLQTTMTFHKLVIASEYVKRNFQTAFKRGEDDILVLGQARNDSLTDDYQFDENIFPEIRWLRQVKQSAEVIISWLPTHRIRSGNTTQDLLDGYSFERSRLERLLHKHNARFVIKSHLLDTESLRQEFGNSDRISVFTYADPYPLLRYTDILITDYSSVYFDYLLLDRPIIFTPFDLGHYIRREADFYHDYDTVTPGVKCRNWEEVFATLERLLSDRKHGKPDPYAEHRKKINALFNQYHGGNCRRIVEALFARPRQDGCSGNV